MNRYAAPAVLATLVLAILLGLPASAADRLFLQVEGIVGDSADRDHVGWIDALALAHELKVDCSGQPSMGDVCGQPDFGAVSVLKQTDGSTPALFGLVDPAGPGLTVVVEACRVTTDSSECYYRVTLHEARLASLRLAADACADPLVCGGTQNESLTLRFRRITWRFVPFVSGQPGMPIERCWDLAQHQAC